MNPIGNKYKSWAPYIDVKRAILKDRLYIGYDKLDGSPCHDCIISAMCTRSFVDKTACKSLQTFSTKITMKELKLNIKEGVMEK